MEVSTKLKSDFKTDFKLAYRATNILADYTNFAQIGLSRKLIGDWKSKLSYRFTRGVSYDQQLALRNRVSLDVSNKWKVNKLQIQYRLKYQYTNKNRTSQKDGVTYSNVLRNKIQLSVKQNKKLKYYIAAESFHFNNSYLLSSYRLGGWLLLDAGKRKELKVGYIFEQKMYESITNINHILNLSFSFNLKKSKAEASILQFDFF